MPSVAAESASPCDQRPPLQAAVVLPMQAAAAAAHQPQVLPVISETFAKDAIIAWFRGEFAAANAIIDVLCSHLAQVTAVGGGGGSEYEAVFAAIHRRRLNWIPILQMQKYYSIADVALELRKVAVNKAVSCAAGDGGNGGDFSKKSEAVIQDSTVAAEESAEASKEVPPAAESNGEVVHDCDSQDCQITDSGSQIQPTVENIEICLDHEKCEERLAQIKLTKGYVAKEPMKGHMVNVLKGLKLYEDVFTESEMTKITDFVHELRVAGQNGALSGETFTLFNKQMKGNKRELIQLGVPIFGQIREDEAKVYQASTLEPIPALLRSLIDHLVMWKLVQDYKRPNCCIINFFDEGEHSQPFLKPPHLDQPMVTLLLSESTMAFGCTLTSDHDGNFKGPLMLTLKEGSLLVMRGNSADMARHVMCSSPIKRISISFFRVRPETNQNQSIPPMTKAMTVWQPGDSKPYTPCGGVQNGYNTMEAPANWNILRAPVVMVAPMRPVILSPRRVSNGGTGVFLPWTVGSRKPAKHLPPRAQKGRRLLALPSPIETHVAESIAESGITV